MASRKPAGDDLLAGSVTLDSIKNKKLREELDELCEQYRIAHVEAKANDQVKKDLMVEIQTIMQRLGLRKVLAPDWFVYESRGSFTAISKERLLEHGVDLDVIEACTDKKTWTYYQVTEPPSVDKKPVLAVSLR